MAFLQKKFYNFDQNCTEKAEKSDFKTKAGKNEKFVTLKNWGFFTSVFYGKNRTDVLV